MRLSYITAFVIQNSSTCFFLVFNLTELVLDHTPDRQGLLCILTFLYQDSFFLLRSICCMTRNNACLYMYHNNSHSPQQPAMLHDLRLQLIASTPHSSSLKHLWSLRASGTWQALSTFWSPSPELKLIAGQTCRDIALACLTCFSFCTSKYLILKNGSPILIQEQILHNTIQLQF